MRTWISFWQAWCVNLLSSMDPLDCLMQESADTCSKSDLKHPNNRQTDGRMYAGYQMFYRPATWSTIVHRVLTAQFALQNNGLKLIRYA